VATIAVEPTRAGPSDPSAAVARSLGRRIASIDIARGAVMVLMAIDHVRVYAGVPAGGPTPGVFFTRWVTHFCAPIFIFLAGTAAYLYGRKAANRAAVARFLLVRGLWLVLLELTLLRFGWTFNFDYANFTFAGVIWCIGWSMVVLAGLVFLPTAALAVIGIAIVAGHNAIAPWLSGGENAGWFLTVLYRGGGFPVGGLQVAVLYSLIPWIGVMAAGYAFGAVMRAEASTRRRACLTLGGVAVALFLVLRSTDLYGDPRPWRPRPAADAPGLAPPPATPPVSAGTPSAPATASPRPPSRPSMPPALAFLNTTKYPASFLFLLMTLGPMLLALPFLERGKGRVLEWLAVFGRVPFFYYVLHIPLIHLAAVGISLVRTPGQTGWLIANHPLLPPPVPEGYRWSLGLLYLVTIAVVAALYIPCRRFARLKEEGRSKILGYL
jgi:uncharacterized membrane protein